MNASAAFIVHSVSADARHHSTGTTIQRPVGTTGHQQQPEREECGGIGRKAGDLELPPRPSGPRRGERLHCEGDDHEREAGVSAPRDGSP